MTDPSLRPAPNKWLTMAAVCLGLGMLMIDTFVVNVALPAITADLNATLGAAEWTVSAYVLVLGVLPLAMGRMGDIFGRKRVYMIGLVIFVVTSAGCGAATSITQLIVLRVGQGVGAAIMTPLTLSILTNAFPPAQRGLAIGLWGGVSGLGLIAGPILGGVIVQGFDWRWIFYVNIPIGAIAVLMGLRFIRESRDTTVPRTVDWPGLLLLSGGLAVFLVALTRANAVGWTDPRVLAGLLGGPVLLVVFWVVELRRTYPLVDVRLFRNRTFTMACVGAFLFSAAVFGSQPFTSLFMQNYLGMTPLQGGLAFVPATALVAAITPFSGIIGQRLGGRLRLLLAGGAISVSVSFVYLLFLTPDSGYLEGMLPAFILRGLGIGTVLSASSLAVMSAVPLARSGLASGTLTMFRQVGTAVGVALMGTVFVHHVDTEIPQRLEGVPAAEVTELRLAAEHFVPAGEGDALQITREAIVDGFIVLAVVGMGLAVTAAVASSFVRHRMLDEGLAIAPPASRVSPAAEPLPGPARSGGGS